MIVVLGHSFCTWPINLVEKLGFMQEVIYSFHMPLFFIASGFVFHRAGSFAELTRKKFSRLFVPWLFFCLLSVAFRILCSPFTRSGSLDLVEAGSNILRGDYYWFLYSLMCILVICNLVRNDKALCVLSLCFAAISLHYEMTNLYFVALGRAVYYLPFFVLGSFLRHFYGHIVSPLQKPKIYLSVMLLAACYTCLMPLREDACSVSRYIVPIVGSLFVWCLACLCKSGVQTLFGHFGRYSLQYYLNHLLIMLPCYYAAKLITPPLFCGC